MHDKGPVSLKFFSPAYHKIIQLSRTRTVSGDWLGKESYQNSWL